MRQKEFMSVEASVGTASAGGGSFVSSSNGGGEAASSSVSIGSEVGVGGSSPDFSSWAPMEAPTPPPSEGPVSPTAFRGYWETQVSTGLPLEYMKGEAMTKQFVIQQEAQISSAGVNDVFTYPVFSDPVMSPVEAAVSNESFIPSQWQVVARAQTSAQQLGTSNVLAGKESTPVISAAEEKPQAALDGLLGESVERNQQRLSTSDQKIEILPMHSDYETVALVRARETLGKLEAEYAAFVVQPQPVVGGAPTESKKAKNILEENPPVAVEQVPTLAPQVGEQAVKKVIDIRPSSLPQAA